jgi:hypothetical protein
MVFSSLLAGYLLRSSWIVYVVDVIITDKILEVSGGQVNLFVSNHGLDLLSFVPVAVATV